MAKYIYCVTDFNGDVGEKGINDSDAYMIKYNGIFAAVSDVPFEEMDPTDENLIAHERVNRRIIIDHKHSVVPVSFCTIAKSEEDVKKILREGYYTFKKNISLLKDKLEFSFKFFCDIKKFEVEYGEKMYEISKKMAKESLEKVKKISVNTKLNDLVIENMIVNASVLLERDKLEAFDKVVKEVDESHGGKLLIKIGGPMAAYSFAEMPGETRI